MNNIEFTFSAEDLQTCLRITSWKKKCESLYNVYALTEGNFLSIHLLENWYGENNPALVTGIDYGYFVYSDGECYDGENLKFEANI